MLKRCLFGVSCVLLIAASSDSGDAGYMHSDWIDKSIDPRVDFYSYADGGWKRDNPVPPGYSAWYPFFDVYRKNQEVIHGILEDLSKGKNPKAGSIEQKAADFYASGMDVQAIDTAGISPLSPELQSIAAIKDTASLQTELARLQMIGVDAVFGFDDIQDFKDSSKVIGTAYQGGLGLPNRDYYLDDSASFQQIRSAYVGHMTRIFTLLGDTDKDAAAEAATTMGIEISLARASMTNVEQRDPKKTYNPMDLKHLDALTPGFSWEKYFADLDYPSIKDINLQMPDFFKAFSASLSNVPMQDWKTYLRWHLVHTYAPYLSKSFVDENLQFMRIIGGVQEVPPRWQQVINAATGSQDNFQTYDHGMGIALGKLYVDKVFPASSKQQVLGILHSLRAAMRSDLETLDWMTPATRAAAIKKLDLMGERIGYPEKWPDYSSLKIERRSYVLNVMAVQRFYMRHDLDKIGKPMDTGVWDALPQAVNGIYEPTMNNVNFPAGLLQPPFFDPKAPAAVNYGMIGWFMGHEMSHGFDDQGGQFDGHGNLRNWWSDEDLKKFHALTRCISDQFSGYTIAGGRHLQGGLVVGEATADLGGLKLAWRAFHASEAYKKAKTIDGFTPDQQFFLSGARLWAVTMLPQRLLTSLTSNPHPPGIYRVNGSYANMPEFQKAFDVPEGSPLVNKNRCVIW
jgi:putative endopeptidase